MRFLTFSEVATIADATGPVYRASVFLGAYGGLRIGEMFALRRDRLDLLRGMVDVRDVGLPGRSAVRRSSRDPPGRRRVPLPKVVTDELGAHLARMPDRGNGLVFPARDGSHVRGDHWRIGVCGVPR